MAIPHVPQEILLEIFLLLPAKSVGKCRCLSKTWKTELSTKHFINSHLKKNQQEEKQLVVVQSGSLKIVNIPRKNEDEVDIQLGNNWFMVLGSCNGLVLGLAVYKNQHWMIVINPVTCQQLNIPSPWSAAGQACGFGYDSSCDDYKVVTIPCQLPRFQVERDNTVHVYSLKRKVWKNVCTFLSEPITSGNWSMPFVNGAVHWLATDNTSESNYRLDAFRLDSEAVYRVPLPKGYWPNYIHNALMVLKGCLGFVDCLRNGSADVWVMKEYGAVDSWVRYHLDVNMIGKIMKPVCSVGNTYATLYATTDDRDILVACNLQDKIISYNGRWSVFAESLVSPNQENVVSG